MDFKTLYDSIMVRKTRRKGMRTYKLNRATGVWTDNTGTTYRLENHGGSRIDMVPIQKETENA